MNNRVSALIHRICGATAVASALVSAVTNVQAAENEEPTRLEEIVVTAQKREERLQDVPISITALSGETLDRSTLLGVAEILRTVPGMTMVPTNGNANNVQLSVRGVTAFSNGGSGGTAVGFYVDSVPFGFVRSALVPNVDAFDLGRVEVLRGPQGTLYGASSLNGVVRVLTKDANLDAFELKGLASASYTEDGEPNYRGDMAVNVPIVEGKLAARLAAGYQEWGGWIDKPSSGEKGANDNRTSNVRLKVNAQPTEDLSIGLLASILRSDDDQHSLGREDDVNVSRVDEPISTDLDNYALKISYGFASFSVISVTSYLEFMSDAVLGLDVPGLGIPLSQRTTYEPRVFVEEINFSSTQDGAWRWTAGGMYRDSKERTTTANIPIGGSPGAPNISEDASKSFAVFGELTRLFLDGQIGLTGGLRYFEDEVTGTEIAVSSGAAPAGRFSREKFDALSPRAVLTWHPSPQKTIYASYSEGFRSGLSQLPSVLRIDPSFTPTKPDKLRNYELGMKSSLWDNRIRLETAVYYMDWQDVQQRVSLLVIPGSGGAGVGVTAGINGKSASGVGVDLQVTARPLDPLEMGFSASWNNLESDGDVISNNVVLIGEGERMNLSAEKTIGAFVNYDFPFGGNGIVGRLSATGTYVSQYPGFRTLQGTNVFATTGGSLLISRASFSVTPPCQ